ncbi:MAG: hypothetical protein AAFN79_13325 [Pseudomonadota bacterium]
MIRAFVLSLAMIAVALPAAAHKLRVFAFVEGETVKVEAKFSSGRIPKAGEVRVMDAEEALVLTLPLDPEGMTSFPLDPDAAADGLMIEVRAGDGHSNYWLLTPADIQRGRVGQ